MGAEVGVIAKRGLGRAWVFWVPVVLSGVALAACGGDGGDDADAGGGPLLAFPPVDDFTQDGPFATTSAMEGPDCTVFRPDPLGEGGLRHPVVVWANGTAGPTGVYAPALRYWASHGFVVAAANTVNGQGDGEEVIACLDYVLDEDGRSGSPYEGMIDREHIGASGHSQGGGGCLMVGRDPRITATAPLQPYIAMGFGGFDRASIDRQNGPMLLLSGDEDTVAVPEMHQRPVYDETNVPVLWASLAGPDGNHVGTALAGLTTFREVMLAWWRVQLMGDADLRDMFYAPACELCGDSDWTVLPEGGL